VAEKTEVPYAQPSNLRELVGFAQTPLRRCLQVGVTAATATLIVLYGEHDRSSLSPIHPATQEVSSDVPSIQP